MLQTKKYMTTTKMLLNQLDPLDLDPVSLLLGCKNISAEADYRYVDTQIGCMKKHFPVLDCPQEMFHF